MARVIWLSEAVNHLTRIVLYVRIFDPGAARRLGDRLFDAGNSLQDFPERGRPSPGGTRELVSVRPYVLRYIVDGDEVRIIGIRHAAQRADD